MARCRVGSRKLPMCFFALPGRIRFGPSSPTAVSLPRSSITTYNTSSDLQDPRISDRHGVNSYGPLPAPNNRPVGQVRSVPIITGVALPKGRGPGRWKLHTDHTEWMKSALMYRLFRLVEKTSFNLCQVLRQPTIFPIPLLTDGAARLPR